MASGEARTSHILIKHKGFRCKSSWKDPDGCIICATTHDATIACLRAFRDILSSKVHFEGVAARHSNCSFAKRGHDLDLYCLFDFEYEDEELLANRNEDANEQVFAVAMQS